MQKASWSFLKAARASEVQDRDLGFWKSMEGGGGGGSEETEVLNEPPVEICKAEESLKLDYWLSLLPVPDGSDFPLVM